LAVGEFNETAKQFPEDIPQEMANRKYNADAKTRALRSTEIKSTREGSEREQEHTPSEGGSSRVNLENVHRNCNPGRNIEEQVMVKDVALNSDDRHGQVKQIGHVEQGLDDFGPVKFCI